MAIEIKHTIDASNLSSQISQGIQEGLSGFSESLKNLGTGKLSNSSPIINSTGKDDPQSNNGKSNDVSTKLTDQVGKLSDAVTRMTQAIENIAKRSQSSDKLAGYAALPAGERMSVMQELKQFESDSKKSRLDEVKERMDFYDKRKSDNRTDSIARGVLTGVGMGAVYQAGNWGQFSGSSAQSINAGANNYGQFMNQYYGNQIDTTKNMVNMGTMGAAGAAGMMFGAPGAAVGMALAGVANYYTGKVSEERKAFNQLGLSQDLASYRMGAYGISGKSGDSLSVSGDQFGLTGGIKVPLTSLQSYMKNNNMGGFLPYSEDVMMSSRLDQMSGMDDPAKARYIKNTARLSQLTGAGIPEIAANVSNLSAMGGGNPNETLNRLYSYQLQYGGDMKTNVGKIISLLQNTGMSQSGAEQLAYKYQNNEPMMQQKVAQSMVSPTNRFLANAYTDIIKEQIGTGDIEEIKKDYRDRTTRSNAGKGRPEDIVISQMEEALFKSSNVNPWVRDIGANQGVPNPNAGSIDALPMTDAQKAMGDMIANALNNVQTMTVTAGVVNLVGNGSNIPMNLSNLVNNTQATPQPTISNAEINKMANDANKITKGIGLKDYGSEMMVPPIVSNSGTGNMGNNVKKRGG